MLYYIILYYTHLRGHGGVGGGGGGAVFQKCTGHLTTGLPHKRPYDLSSYALTYVALSLRGPITGLRGLSRE